MNFDQLNSDKRYEELLFCNIVKCIPPRHGGQRAGMSSVIIFFTLIILLLAIVRCKDDPRHTILNDKIALKRLKEDFTYFRLILEAVHPGLYLYTTESNMNRNFDSVYRTLDADATLMDFYNRLAPIVTSIRCGHTGIFIPELFEDSVHKIRGYFPIPVNMVEGKLIVNSNEFLIPVGAEIVSINHEKISSLLQPLSKYEPVDGFNQRYQQEEGGWDFSLNYFKNNGAAKSFLVGYKKDSGNMVLEKTVAAETFTEILFHSRHFSLPNDVNYDMELVDERGYAVLTIYTFGYDTWSTDKAFENFISNSFRLLKESSNIRNLIIDLRNNTGGNFHNMFQLYSYLTHKPKWQEFKSAYTVFNRIPFTPYLARDENDVALLQASLDYSFGTKREGRTVRQYKDNETMYRGDYPFNGNIFLLTNSNVQSAAAYFAALLKDEGIATIVGNETGGSGTNTNSFHLLTYELPNSKIRLTVPVVHAEFSLENKRNAAGHGVTPDYPVSLSLAGLVENTDTQLNFIIDSLIK